MQRPAPLAVAAGVHLALALSLAAGPAHAGQEARSSDPSPETRGADASGHTEADVRFLQEMIVHHGQALEMAALVPERTAREEIRRLARRIEAAQRDEIARMRQWLEDRGEEVPSLEDAGGHAHAEHEHAEQEPAGVPGMITREQLSSLAEAEGEAFDRLFLEHMIVHHQGALVMVGRLFAAPDAGQETEIYLLASHIDADQRAEIERMRRLLDADP